MAGIWGKRFLALIIDALIISLFLWVIIALIYPLISIANLYGLLGIWIPLAALLIIAYFTYFEGKYSMTPGKNAMKLKVIAEQGGIDYRKACIRNLSKILWLPLIVDVIIGFIIGSPKERFLDRLAKTRVVSVEEIEQSRKNLGQSLS